MKKLFVSTGLAAIGMVGLQSAFGQGLDLVSPKAWSVSGTLRGFYDDNYNISGTKRGSWGLEVSPNISYNLPLQQTDMGIRYIYGLYYYNDRDNLGLDPFDQSHEVDLWLDHAINERWKINFTDTFNAGRDPALTAAGTTPGVAATVYRVGGDNIANHANITLDTQWTKLFGTSLHYGNDFYSYQNSGAGVTTNSAAAFVPTISSVPGNRLYGNQPGQFSSLSGNGGNGASLAGLLDRIEQNIGLDLNWTLSPELVLSAGYSYSWVNYFGNEPISVFNYFYAPNSHTIPVTQSYVFSSTSRNGTSHDAHVGLSDQLTANISLNAVIGVAYSDNTGDPFEQSENISPTASVSMNYTYTPGSYVQVGVSQGQNSSDIVQPGVNGSITQYEESTAFFADWNQKITQKLMGTVIGQYTYSSFKGGQAATATESTVDLGLNLTYQISTHFSADAGYNFDDLWTGLAGQAFSRNRVYLGMTASY